MDELIKRVEIRDWYSLAHITGPTAVRVALCFGKMPADGPAVIKTVGRNQNDATTKLDLGRYVKEVLEGVAEANAKHGGSLEVEAIQIVPDDYPSLGQVKYVASKITERALTNRRQN